MVTVLQSAASDTVIYVNLQIPETMRLVYDTRIDLIAYSETSSEPYYTVTRMQ